MLPLRLFNNIRSGQVGIRIASLGKSPICAPDGRHFAYVVSGELRVPVSCVGIVVLAGERVFA